MKVAELTIDRFLHASVLKHVRIQMYEDAASNLIHVLAKTPPTKPLQVHVRREMEVNDCYWVTQRWARLIRWMTSRKWTRWMIPYPLKCLANASEVGWKSCAHEIPEHVQDSIHAQIANLYKDGKRVDRILVGYEALHQAGQSLNFSMMPLPHDHGDVWHGFEGFPMLLCSRLEENSVLVLEQLP